MTRHAKNCTAGAVYTYHERQHDTKASGYGTKAVRLGKDSIKDFDCCSLTLQPCRNSVITPDGHVYDKEAILEYILQKKKEISKKLKEYEKQKNKDKQEASELAKAEQESKLQNFVAKSKGVGSKALEVASAKDAAEAGSSSSTPSVASDAKKLPSFWIPSLTPQASASKVEKPDEKVRCPMSGGVLRLKDLIDITFTPINDRDNKKSLIVKDARYVCAVTGDVLGNSVPCAALRTSGNVVTMECVEKLIKKDMIDPTCGKKLREKDIIQLVRGSTGFSGAGVQLNAEKAGPALQG